MEECLIKKDVWSIILQYCNLETLCSIRCTCKALCDLGVLKKRYLDWRNLYRYQRLVRFENEWGSPRFWKSILNSCSTGTCSWTDFHALLKKCLLWDNVEYALVLLGHLCLREDAKSVLKKIIRNTPRFPSFVWKKFVVVSKMKKRDLNNILLAVFRTGFWNEHVGQIEFCIENGFNVKAYCFFDSSQSSFQECLTEDFQKYVLSIVPWNELQKLRHLAQKKTLYYFCDSWHLVEEEYQRRLSLEK